MESILGKSEIIKTLLRSSGRIYEGYYRPDKMVFSVSGNFDENNVIELLKNFQIYLRELKITPKADYQVVNSTREKLGASECILGFEGVDLFRPYMPPLYIQLF